MKFTITTLVLALATNIVISQNTFPSTGNAGIGTTSPQYALDIKSNGFITRNINLDGGKLIFDGMSVPTDLVYSQSKILTNEPIFVYSETPAFRLRSTNSEIPNFPWSPWIDIAIAHTDNSWATGISKLGDIVLRSHTPGSFIISNEGAGDIKFVTREIVSGSSTVSMLLDKYGNLGIGTETPDARLAVNGLIHAKEVKVDLLGWPDYVFNDGYKLPTLEEVEHFINKHGHLKNIPNAKEVETDGVKIGEMNKLLLEKIEELTLYLIEVNKELQNTKKELKELKNKKF